MNTRRQRLRRSLFLYVLCGLAAYACAPASATPRPPAPAATATRNPVTTTTAQRPYRILVTNDDGVRAPGILAVAQALQPLGEITIAAPSENQSGKSHSIVTSDPIFVEQVTLTGGLHGYSIV